MRTLPQLVALGFMACVGMISPGCQDSGGEDTKRTSGSDGISAPANINPNSLAIEIVNELNENLVHRTPLTEEQARMVATRAAGALEIAKIELRLAGVTNAETYEDRIEEFADELVEGALGALDELENVHQRQVNKVLEEIVASIMESLENRTDHLDSVGLGTMLYLLAEGAMQHLDEAGYSIQSMAEGARTIASAAIGGLDDAGVLTPSNGRDILVAIVSGTIQGLAESPLARSTNKATEYSLVIDDLLYGAVGSLDDAGFSLEEIDDSIAHVIFAALSRFDELGFKVEALSLPIGAALHGTIDALKREAGVSDPADIEKALGFCVRGAVESLAHSSLTLEQMDEVIGIIVKKTVQHVDNLGVSHEETETVMEEIVLSAIESMDGAGFNTEHVEAYGDVMADITVATMEGLSEVGFNNAEITDFLDDMIASAFKPLVGHQFSRQQSEVVGTHFMNGLQTGLAASTEIVFTYDSASVTAHVQAALDAAYQ
ncbi:MAG TPA: hypothetical protein VE954_22670 [Oligoflexus sp.]|uniref:hypothetical protein n=1 Tax=Oligoflexus sp. TaxID=1971216 RepID=UPI002D71D723|nr:hypothetical protein [Oligoflexus sp.]HYX35914.1 hypothetical protein [Oligoflexus sp.]